MVKLNKLLGQIHDEITVAKMWGINPRTENWIKKAYQRSHYKINFDLYRQYYLRKLKKMQPPKPKIKSKKTISSTPKQKRKSPSNDGFNQLLEEGFNWEAKLKLMKLNIDLSLRRDIFDFIFSHFQSKDIKNPRDFKKIFNLLIEKFGKKTCDEKTFQKIFLLAYKAYKTHLQNESIPSLLTDSQLKEWDKTLVIPHPIKRGQIQDSTEYALRIIRSIQLTRLLTKEQEQMYSRMVLYGKTEEERARGREKLITANLRLIISIAKKYNNKGIPLPDLIDEGLIGLNKAIDKFQPEKGFKFATYATWWIRQAVTRIISDKGRVVRIPVHLIEQISKASKEERNLALRGGSEPTQRNLKTKVKDKYRINLLKLTEIKKTSSEPIYFDKVIGDNNDSKFGDFLADETLQRPDQHVADEMQNKLIDEMFEKVLTDEERDVIMRYYGFGQYERNGNLTNIAKQLDSKPEIIKGLYASAMEKLRRSKLGKNLGVKID